MVRPRTASSAPPPSTSAIPESLAVWLDDGSFGPMARIGTLSRSGVDSVRFAYERAWLERPGAFQLDPEMLLADGDFYPRDSNFGIFLDSCPDRWGQTLMKRRELVQAKAEGRPRRELHAWDFLLGVQDVTRMGALRFSPATDKGRAELPDDAAFLANEALSAPAVTRLRELQQVALELTRKKVEDLSLLEQWLRVLVAPGASLGGARPKANLQDQQGVLWIAKFPAADDEHDWALREMLLHQLAAEFGLDVAPARVERIGPEFHTFITRRFDRHAGRRRFFVSAMALLGHTEHDQASYPELAEFLSNRGHPEHLAHDLRELFRRVLFNVATSNRDDHLRNHGFIRAPEGWRLAPAYDMNPSTRRDVHVLALDDADPHPDIGLVLSTASLYRMGAGEARAEWHRLRDVLGGWNARAKRMGLGAEERGELEACFLLE
jgi:serine/threonine-protein kinase HipA